MELQETLSGSQSGGTVANKEAEMETTLYTLTEDYKKIMEMAMDPEADEEAVQGTMDMIQDELSDKVDGYGKVIRSMEAQSAAVDAEIKRLQERKKAIDNGCSRVKSRLQAALESLPERKAAGTLFKFWIQKSPKAVKYTTSDLTKIPEEFIVNEPKINTARVKEALTNGFELPFAHFEQGETLRMK